MFMVLLQTELIHSNWEISLFCGKKSVLIHFDLMLRGHSLNTHVKRHRFDTCLKGTKCRRVKPVKGIQTLPS